jgi:hypothetical protein
MRNEANASKKSAICRAIGILENPALAHSSSLGPTDDWNCLNANRAWIELAIALAPSQVSNVLAVIALTLRTDSTVGSEFATALETGAALAIDDPRYVLREHLLRGDRTHSNSADRAISLLKTATAITSWIGEEKIKKQHVSAQKYIIWSRYVGVEPNRSLLAVAGK